MSTTVSLYILALCILTISSGFFSASEIAIFSLSHSQLKLFRHHQSFSRRLIARLMEKPRDLLVTVFLFNTIVNILLQNVTSGLFGSASSWLFRVGVPLIITLILGEIIPKFLAMRHNIAISTAVVHPIHFLQQACTPLRRVITSVTSILTRLMFFFLRRDATTTHEEIQHILHTSQEAGMLTQEEVRLVTGYLRLRTAQVKELMRPKEDIICYDIQRSLGELSHSFTDLECTRIPVYDGQLDKLLGLITAQTFFSHRNEIHHSSDLPPLLDKPLFVPETASAPSALRQLDSKNHEVALVVDEYGSITGLISYEDLVEEVIGEIFDRRDEHPSYTPSGDNVLIASGKMELAALEEVWGIELESDANMVTVGGYLTEKMGDIPKSGSSYQDKKLFFHILAADPNRVRRVYIRRLPEKED